MLGASARNWQAGVEMISIWEGQCLEQLTQFMWTGRTEHAQLTYSIHVDGKDRAHEAYLIYLDGKDRAHTAYSIHVHGKDSTHYLLNSRGTF